MMEDKVDALSITDDEDDSEEDQNNIFEKKGVLSKWTNYLHGWQDRYIVLKDGTLSYYKSENDLSFGCRGAVSLSRASVTPHQFDECRFDVAVNDSVWYLRGLSEDERQIWIDAIEAHRQGESGYGSESSLRRQGSVLSLTSGTSLSTTSASSFKRGRGLREKLAEMDTFRDILCRQIETLQSYFDSCASAVAHGAVNDLNEDDIGDPDDFDSADPNHSSAFPVAGHSARDLASILQQHGSHSVDFKGEAFTFKATTAGIIATLSHCIELMSQREDAWRKKLEKETERRKKFEDAYRIHRQEQKQAAQRPVIGGPDYEEGPHCAIKEDEFFDAVDASLDKLEKEEEDKVRLQKKAVPPPKISLSPENRYYKEINKIVTMHMESLQEKGADGGEIWQVIAQDGELKVFKRELTVDGVVLDPMRAVHTVTGITGHEVCQHFWDVKVRLDWESTLDTANTVEWLAEDTVICHNVIKRVWPASQRDALFWSHIRHVQGDSDEEPDLWIVVNYSTEHHSIVNNKYVRVTMNVAMVCQTIIEPPITGNITRDHIKCKISYTAEVNPGGWAPASVLRAVYKREYPKFLKRFTSYVKDATRDSEIMF